ncbi:16S rRNA (guanine(1207)-N(2))-methyltransferase RsmC [Morganella morganii]|uniref:16S rRNA (guanine(1207)-N(2))-methyltransferase RsmC n=1 Tax=Morganella morganii TaxID=582 RepID=UPI001A261067|nr:16S rRNA (guanine(1207)-N(2))-methyltransferase RsmC [Morganella morganii]MCU6224308.1 16S rRNA (guanine(1207)-N(2))-methyltransferase RsmC [Morganella morganii]MCU6232545.1 16S rRNA (guanine(1207)-N(2))-methyltransferase RsmC [Morganella morganii]HAT1526425.1 16S rRNA (guanine(1207)-N(2))-methyltransferase RsmC [Morganella morganii]HDF2366056.1 16S rRNA (guanine(1207)-N(2))-methyltransferase RsmC [Morganella morganii]HDF2424325.1 16S rRNA (guanine(1207)-N(2))-methyltransferase RsmC [Morgan
MSMLTPASEVILRHADEFTGSRVLLAGDIQDSLAAQLSAQSVYVSTSQYHQWQALRAALGDRAAFALTVSPEAAAQCDTLIYFWPKSKQEALFQLTQIFSCLPVGSNIFIVGENRSGVRSAEKMTEPFTALRKIDSARRCGLYYGELTTPAHFALQEWIGSYTAEDTQIVTLPGVFSQDNIDAGSALLLESLNQPVTGSLLDIACGSGVIATVLAKRNPGLTLTLSDVSAAALEAGRATLAQNQLEGRVIASDVYSDISDRYDWIVANPPFHDGLNTSYSAAQRLISGAKARLNRGGKLCIVANAFLPYPDLLDSTFGRHQVLAQTGKFKVYLATNA